MIAALNEARKVAAYAWEPAFADVAVLGVGAVEDGVMAEVAAVGGEEAGEGEAAGAGDDATHAGGAAADPARVRSPSDAYADLDVALALAKTASAAAGLDCGADAEVRAVDLLTRVVANATRAVENGASAAKARRLTCSIEPYPGLVTPSRLVRCPARVQVAELQVAHNAFKAAGPHRQPNWRDVLGGHVNKRFRRTPQQVCYLTLFVLTVFLRI